MDTKRGITSLGEPINAFVLHFSRFPGGAENAITRIPEKLHGIYFWYRAFNYPVSKEGFTDALKADLVARKFPTRIGQVKPYFEVSVGSSSVLSRGKMRELDTALENENFRKHLGRMLELSIIFQTPLYIGKSRDIRARTATHLTSGSPLQNRLSECNLRIKDTALLVMPLDEDVDLNLNGMDDELLYEEIFSRLFNPLLNLRIG